MDVSAPVGPPPSAPQVSEAMFAALRQEAESPTEPSISPERHDPPSNTRLTFPGDMIRAAAIRRTLQRKLEANEIIRPAF